MGNQKPNRIFEKYADECIQCGICLATCDLLNDLGLSPGEIAQAIVQRVRQGENAGAMTLDDLKAYRPKSGPALCRPYRAYIVCTPGAPSGGPAVLEGLGLLERTDVPAHPNTVEGWYLFSQASRLMYADRDRYMGDPDFVKVPVEGLLDRAYLDERAKLIGPAAAASVTFACCGIGG